MQYPPTDSVTGEKPRSSTRYENTLYACKAIEVSVVNISCKVIAAWCAATSGVLPRSRSYLTGSVAGTDAHRVQYGAEGHQEHEVLVADGSTGGLKGGAPLVALHEIGQGRTVHECCCRQQDEDVDAAQGLRGKEHLRPSHMHASKTSHRSDTCQCRY